MSLPRLRSEAADDLTLAVKLCDPKYAPGKVHRFVATLLRAVAQGRIKRLILDTPPQHGKSRLCAVEFPAWLLGRDPTRHIITASYAQELADRNGRGARARMQSDRYQALFDTRLEPSHQRADSWATTAGGGYIGTGIGGGLTGHAADVIVIDDPFKDHAEAHSPASRERVWDWFLSVAYTRLSPAGAIIIIMTRWHVDDLVGRLLDPERQTQMQDAGVAEEDWHCVNLPALAKPGDPLGRPEGAALWPERYDVNRLNAIRQVLGGYKWSALYDGSPTIKGGNYVSMNQFRVIRPTEVPQGLRWVRFWDLATSEKEAVKPAPDYTASAKAAVDREGTLYVSDILRGQWKWPEARERIKTIA